MVILVWYGRRCSIWTDHNSEKSRLGLMQKIRTDQNWFFLGGDSSNFGRSLSSAIAARMKRGCSCFEESANMSYNLGVPQGMFWHCNSHWFTLHAAFQIYRCSLIHKVLQSSFEGMTIEVFMMMTVLWSALQIWTATLRLRTSFAMWHLSVKLLLMVTRGPGLPVGPVEYCIISLDLSVTCHRLNWQNVSVNVIIWLINYDKSHVPSTRE